MSVRRASSALLVFLTLICAAPTGASSASAQGDKPAISAQSVVDPTTMAEANKPGSPWRIADKDSGGIEGYANHTSVGPGQSVTLYVSTGAQVFRVRAFRMGWYRGQLARQEWISAPVTGHKQPGPSVFSSATRTMTAKWRPSVTISTRGWLPGDYLLRLDARNGHKSFIPLAVHRRSASGRVVFVNAVTTWQAYNLWGCCDLYEGGNGSFATRSRAVTFDRPYVKENGAGQFIRDELGVVAEAERLGLPVDYVTDVDLHANPDVLDGARAVVSMGHDEYWSPQMRKVLTAARSRGTNLAFFGANSIFRRIRFGRTALGQNRLEINYKVASEDPLYGRNNPAVTADWPSAPAANPESSLLGAQYGCYFGAAANVAGVITAPGNWMYAGVKVHQGERLPNLIGPEIDAIQYRYPTPRPIISIMHSPSPCPNGSPAAADASYYVAPSKAGVFDAGSINWACEVGPTCGGQLDKLTHAVVRQVTDNVLQAFARGPAGRVHPLN